MAFTGDSIRVELTADGRTPITARLPKTMADPPRVGTVVKIWWREQTDLREARIATQHD